MQTPQVWKCFSLILNVHQFLWMLIKMVCSFLVWFTQESRILYISFHYCPSLPCLIGQEPCLTGWRLDHAALGICSNGGYSQFNLKSPENRRHFLSREVKEWNCLFGSMDFLIEYEPSEHSSSHCGKIKINVSVDSVYHKLRLSLILHASLLLNDVGEGSMWRQERRLDIHYNFILDWKIMRSMTCPHEYRCSLASVWNWSDLHCFNNNSYRLVCSAQADKVKQELYYLGCLGSKFNHIWIYNTMPIHLRFSSVLSQVNMEWIIWNE